MDGASVHPVDLCSRRMRVVQMSARRRILSTVTRLRRTADKPIHYIRRNTRVHLAPKCEKRLAFGVVAPDGFSKRSVIRRAPANWNIDGCAMYNGAIFSAVSAPNDAENHTSPPNRFSPPPASFPPSPWLPDDAGFCPFGDIKR